jgi:hypothetical protein
MEERRVAVEGGNAMTSATENAKGKDKMTVSSQFEYNAFGCLKQQDGETGNDFFHRLQEFYGCKYCEDYGDNGCGCWQIGGYEFNGAEEGENGEMVVGNPEDVFYDDWTCVRLAREEHAKELEEQKQKGTLVFVAAIEKAPELAPNEQAATQ